MLKNKFSFVLALSTLFFFSCKEDPSDLGLNTIPNGDKVLYGVNDTTVIYGKILSPIPEASFALDYTLINSTTSKYLDYVTVGNLNDNVFGEVQAGLVTSFTWGVDNGLSGVHDIGPLIVNLGYSKAHVEMTVNTNNYKNDTTWTNVAATGYSTGNFNQNFKVEVFEVIRAIPPIKEDGSSINYKTSFINDSSSFIDSKNLVTSYSVTDTTIRIVLENSYAKRIANAYNEDSVKLTLKGLYFVVTKTSGDGYLWTFSMNDKTKNNLDLQDKGGKSLHTLTFQNWNDNGGLTAKDILFTRVNTFNYPNPVKPTTDTVLYVQNKGGIKSSFTIPALDTLNKQNFTFAVNKAELIVPMDLAIQEKSYFKKEKAPTYLYLGKDDNGDGIYDYYAVGIKDTTTYSYVFDLTRIIQPFISTNKGKSDYIITTDIYPYNLWPAYGIALKNSTGSKKIKLKLKYSKF